MQKLFEGSKYSPCLKFVFRSLRWVSGEDLKTYCLLSNIWYGTFCLDFTQFQGKRWGRKEKGFNAQGLMWACIIPSVFYDYLVFTSAQAQKLITWDTQQCMITLRIENLIIKKMQSEGSLLQIFTTVYCSIEINGTIHSSKPYT